MLIVLFLGWYLVATDYDYPMVAGSYAFHGSTESSTLLLKKDHSFVQERVRNGKMDKAKGEWYRYGEGGIGFTAGFLEVGGVFPASDGHTHGEVLKTFLNLIPSIVLGQDWDSGPRFRRMLFHSAKLERQ